MLASTQFIGRLFLAIVIVLLIATFAVFAQTRPSPGAQAGTCDDSDSGPRYVARSVKIVARWAPLIQLPLKPNDPFSPEKIRETRLAFLKAMVAEKGTFNAESISLGKLPIVDVRYVRVCGRVVPEPDCFKAGLAKDCVDVEVRPFALSTDPAFLASVFQPIPRSNKFSFLSNVSRPLRLLNPKFSLERDEKLGTMPGFEVSTDLLSLGKIVHGEPGEAKKVSLMLAANARKSIGRDFYNSQTQLALKVSEPNENIESLGLDTAFTSDAEPQRDSVYHRNMFSIGGHIAFTPAVGVVNQIVVSGGYRRSENNLAGDGVRPRISRSENSFEGRAFFDGRIAEGFARFGIWFERSSPAASSSRYNRVAGLIGYQKEIPVSGDAIGIEALAGTGWASNSAPEYALFYGGNGLNNFLYEEPLDFEISRMPAGPLMRSFGKNQAGLPATLNRQVGANSYRHLNLTVSIPIPGLSKPLIPDEVINENPRITLRDVVDFAVNTGEEALSSNLQDKGLTEEEADKKAAKTFGQIRPGVRFLTNYAKIYAVKPLVMFDTSSMRQRGTNFLTRYAIGGGIQLTLAVAKFELGYMHNTRRFAGDARGNVVMRLVFQNLF
ncbi:MAG: hypothetical protein ABI999_09370 [Acidobacteriota bacterium]